MMRGALSIMLAVVLASPVAPAQPPGRTLKEQVLNISRGSVVEVRLADKTKLRGPLGAVSDSGFELQIVKAGTIVTSQVAFDQVKSVKDTTKKSFGHSLSRSLLITGIIAGTVFGIGLIVCLANHCVGG